MDVIRRLFGGTIDPEPQQPRQRMAPRQNRRSDMSEDERALERYRYLLRTAPPETLEQAHAEAFAQLSPEQRQMVLQQLTADLPESERMAAASGQDDPRALARVATRAEMRQPGTLERRFGGMGGGGGMGMGGMMAGSFLSTIAGVMVGSAIANAFFNDTGYNDSTGEGGGGDEAAADSGDAGDAGADGGFDGGGGDGGGDFGGDFGGGDFGGGDFGGGDF